MWLYGFSNTGLINNAKMLGCEDRGGGLHLMTWCRKLLCNELHVCCKPAPAQHACVRVLCAHCHPPSSSCCCTPSCVKNELRVHVTPRSSTQISAQDRNEICHLHSYIPSCSTVSPASAHPQARMPRRFDPSYIQGYSTKWSVSKRLAAYTILR